MIRWYYANDNQRQGPVSDSEFARLVREGVIGENTLVWRHGMKDWQRYADVAPSLPPPEIPSPAAGASSTGVEAMPAASAPAATLEPEPPALRYAGFWPRAAAKLLDWLVLLGLGRLLLQIVGFSDVDLTPLVEGNVQQMMGLMRSLALISFVDSAMRLGYYWYFMRRYAATPGKLILGLKVVRSDGSPLSHGRIVARFFSEVLSKYFTLGIGYLVAAFDPERRTLHDHICDTRVVARRE